MRRRVLALRVVSLLAISGFVRSAAVPVASATHAPPSTSEIAGSTPWAAEAPSGNPADLGFSSLSVTQSGVVYTQPAEEQEPSVQTGVADLPAWTSSFAPKSRFHRHGLLAQGGYHRFGSLPEPAAWALMLVGVGMIGGALRGLLVANRRLAKLRAEDPSQ